MTITYSGKYEICIHCTCLEIAKKLTVFLTSALSVIGKGIVKNCQKFLFLLETMALLTVMVVFLRLNDIFFVVTFFTMFICLVRIRNQT